MSMLEELLKLLRRRSRELERLARKSITVELADIYRAKAAEAEAIYVIVYNMKMKLLKERARDAEITDK